MEELEHAYFATTRRSVSPTAIGRTEIFVAEESGLRRAMRRAEHRNGESEAGIFPERDQLIKVSRECRSEIDAAELDLTQSAKCEGRKPDGPGAEARGKD